MVAPAFAQVPSDEEIRVNTEKYIVALTEKGQRVHVNNANRILKFLKTEPQAARGMYMAYKMEWDKILGWEETKSSKHLKHLNSQLDSAERLSSPTDTKSFGPYELEWRRLEGEATFHLNTYCKDTTDNTCEPAKKIRDEALKKVVAAWNLALTTEAIEFDAIQDLVIQGEREELYAPHVKLDTWVPQLAKEKELYWRNFLQKEGGLLEYAKKQNEAKCVPVTKKVGAKMDLGLIKYLYGPKDKVLLRCEFLTAPSKWQKFEQGPYWQVSIWWAGRWELMRTYPVRKPETNTLGHWEWNAADLHEEIKKKIAANNFVYPGNWARVQIDYIHPYILEWVWKDGKKVPVWRYPAKASTSVFLKWR